jgi:hypothetical protein
MYDRAYWTRQLIYFLVRVLIIALFLLTPRALLKQVSEKNRTLRPDLVWLNLIPVFEFVWIPITLVKIRSSVRAEVLARGYANPANESAFHVGLASWLLYLATNILVLLPYGSDALLVVLVLVELTFLGLWIAYWVKLAHLKNDLMVDRGIVGAVAASRASGDRCSSCGAAVYEGDEYCRLCGAATGSETASGASVAMGTPVLAPAEPTSSEAAAHGGDPGAAGTGAGICPFCATPYRANARFCSSCGRPAV